MFPEPNLFAGFISHIVISTAHKCKLKVWERFHFYKFAESIIKFYKPDMVLFHICLVMAKPLNGFPFSAKVLFNAWAYSQTVSWAMAASTDTC